jgi:hypothetical protein
VPNSDEAEVLDELDMDTEENVPYKYSALAMAQTTRSIALSGG